MQKKREKLKIDLYNTLKKQRKIILSIKDLTVSRSRKNIINPIIEDVNLEILEGEVVGFIGESGAGKTTLLKAILNEQELKMIGQVKMLGADMFRDRNAIAHKFGFVPQSLEYLYDNMTAMENLMIFGRQYGEEDKIIKERANLLLGNLNIKGIQKDELPISKLSGGEKRRVSMACGLIHKPDILIMDEPTTGLDPILRFENFWRYIEKINDIYKTTILIITHFPEESKFFDKIAILVKDKGFLEYGDPKTILKRLPNEGAVTDLLLKDFGDGLLLILKGIKGVRNVLMQGERFRIFANASSKETVFNITKVLSSNGMKYKIHKIEAKRQATMTDYFKILSLEGIVEYKSSKEQKKQEIREGLSYIDIFLKMYDDRILTDLENVKGIKDIEVLDERIRVYIDGLLMEPVLNVVQRITSSDKYNLHKIDIVEKVLELKEEYIYGV